MPARRTQDVIEVTMTDHLIQRTPGTGTFPGNPVARIAKQQAEVVEVRLFEASADLDLDGRKIVNRMAILGYSGGRADYANRDLQEVLRRAPGADYEPWLELAESFVALGDLASATEALQQVLARDPGNVAGREISAIIRFRSGDPQGAIADLETALAEYPRNAKMQFNVAAMRAAVGENATALIAAHKTLDLNASFWPAWQLIGKLQAALGDDTAAAEAFYHALAIEPDAPNARSGLIAALDALGRQDEAEYYRAP
jgi:tetratricopeptide (TPR) repeat protein